MGSPHRKRSQGSWGKGLDHDSGPPPLGSPPPPGGPPPPPGDPVGPPGTCPPDVPGPYDVDVMLVLLICTGAVIVVVIVLDGTGMDSANAASAVSS